MQQIGVRELKNQATEIVREVREQQAEYVITYRGKPVALILPFTEDWQQSNHGRARPASQDLEALWAEWDELAEEIDAHWTAELGAVELLSKDRDA